MRSLQLLEPYPPLSPLHWLDIPPLAILTGLNGVGKTRFLERLAAHLNALRIERFWNLPSTLKLEPRPASGGYLPALWQLSNVEVSHKFFEPVNKLTQILDDEVRKQLDFGKILELLIEEFKSSLSDDAKRVAETLRAREQLTPPISRTNVLAALNTYDLVKPEPTNPLTALAQIFYAYANAQATGLLKGELQDQIDARLGRPPWDQANDLLQRFEMGFQLTIPDDLRFAYELLCRFPDRLLPGTK
jgi:hypothetical protein